MRKLALILVVALMFSMLSIPAYAAEPRMTSIVPGLTFDGTIANCSVSIVGNTTSEEMDATIRLYRGNTCIATWYAEGNGYIFFSQTKPVSRGYTYKLTVDLTVDGTSYSPVSVSNTLS